MVSNKVQLYSIINTVDAGSFSFLKLKCTDSMGRPVDGSEECVLIYGGCRNIELMQRKACTLRRRLNEAHRLTFQFVFRVADVDCVAI